MEKIVSYVGVPLWLGQARYGVNLGPKAILDQGLIKCLNELDVRVADEGMITVCQRDKVKYNERHIRHIHAVAADCEKLAKKVSKIVAQNRFPLIVGGDHSISIGTLAGIAKHYENLGVIWFDAHTDINTDKTTPSGNIHGMPVAASLGLGHPDLTGIGGYIGKIKPENIVFIGVRDIDEGEKTIIRDLNIKCYTAEDVRKLGIKDVIDQSLDYLAHCDGLHLSFDLDGIDPDFAPGVGTPVGCGVSWQDGLAATRYLWESKKVTSAEFVEYNPLFDSGDKTAQLAVQLIAVLLSGNMHQKQHRQQSAKSALT